MLNSDRPGEGGSLVPACRLTPHCVLERFASYIAIVSPVYILCPALPNAQKDESPRREVIGGSGTKEHAPGARIM